MVAIDARAPRTGRRRQPRCDDAPRTAGQAASVAAASQLKPTSNRNRRNEIEGTSGKPIAKERYFDLIE